MKINSVSAVFPSRVVSVDDTIDLIRFHSHAGFSGQLDLALRQVSKLLVWSGAHTRRWLGEGETPIGLIKQAADTALIKADLDKQDVELVIYVGAGRGFLEPGNSYFVADALGLTRVDCFDVLDACMSYVRALYIADSFFKAGRYKTIMIVNGEFTNKPGGHLFPGNYALESMEQLEWTFPTYTVGDAACVTLLSADEERPWEWHFTSRTDLSDLCTAPAYSFEGYALPKERVAKNGAGRFCSFGKDMHEFGFSECVDIFRKLEVDPASIVRVFPHASSKKMWADGALELGISEKMVYVYPEYGNLVSASVPAGIALAEQAGDIQRGERLAGWVGSAGMSFSSFSFEF